MGGGGGFRNPDYFPWGDKLVSAKKLDKCEVNNETREQVLLLKDNFSIGEWM